MRKENWENPETNISMVNFMMLTIFFFNVRDWDEGQKAIAHWNVTLYLGKRGCLLQVFFEFVRIEGCYLNITYEKKRSSGGPSLCYFLHKCKMKFFTISYIKECCYAYKTYTKYFFIYENTTYCSTRFWDNSSDMLQAYLGTIKS